jgi:hypothetical protein
MAIGEALPFGTAVGTPTAADIFVFLLFLVTVVARAVVTFAIVVLILLCAAVVASDLEQR